MADYAALIRLYGPENHLKPKRPGYFGDGSERRIPLARECLVQAFTARAGLSGELAHVVRTGDDSQGVEEECGIVSGLFQTGFHVPPDVFVTFEIGCRVPAGCRERHRAIP